ncbi:MAG: small multi-drug export protein [Clostridia bacterium]|nr:small multi-drug export protein [Clostridia bacterium]MDY4083898.1 small multi-drug export protein [Eubacteriales bacterium]
MIDSIIEFFRNVLPSDYLTIIIISMIPLIEVRGAIPVAVAMDMNIFQAFACAFLGSSLVAPILLLILQPILKWMKNTKAFRSLAHAVEGVFQSKVSAVQDKADKAFDPKIIERKKLLGVFAFVAVPIPMTGVWTGSAVASFMGLGFVKSMLMVILGNIVASSIITLLSYFLSNYIDYIIYGLMAIVLVALVAYIVKLVVSMRRSKSQSNDEDTSNSERKE